VYSAMEESWVSFEGFKLNKRNFN